MDDEHVMFVARNNDFDYEDGREDREGERVTNNEAEESEMEEKPQCKQKGKKGEEEDIVGRYEYEIDEAVAEFVDEYCIERNTIPESSDEEEEDPLVLKEKRMRRKKDDKFALGSCFYSGYEFKEAVLEYAMSKPWNIKQDRWDKTKISFICGMGGKCKWRVYCSYDKPSQKWLVKTKYDYHSCIPNGKCKLLKSSVIAGLFLDKLRQEADLMPEKIQNIIKDKWKIVSTRNQCQRGRLIALKWLDKEYAEQFSHMRGYVHEIQTSNPGSTALLETYPNVAGQDVFSRFYVCFAKLRSIWRGYCRPIIGLDGTFLKVAVKGVLLTAVGHDANNQIYPIAWAVVQSETIDNWVWFVKLIKADLVLGNGDGFVIISDRSKGLFHAVKTELPASEHRMCVKHIIDNLKKRHSNKDLLKPKVWNLAWSYSATQYEENLHQLRDYNMTLFEDVMKENPKTWTRAFFKLGSFCEDVDNNATESFNSTITKARAKAMVPMLETIRRQAMERITRRKKKSKRHTGRFSKYVGKMLALQKKDAENCKTYPATQGLYEVVLYGNSYNVNTIRSSCSCGKWQITGIPCEHAYGAMIDASLDVEEHVSYFFSSFMWQEIYNSSINPIRGPRFWMNSEFPLIISPPVPELPGKKKKKKQTKFPRKKGKHESPKKKKKKEIEKLSRVRRICHCSKCGEAGHNAAGCKIHPKKKIKKEPGEENGFGSSQRYGTISLSQPTQTPSDIEN